MSQVVVEKDNLSESRIESKKQERRIDISSFKNKWVRSDVTKVTLVERVVGLAMLPILGIWVLMSVLAGVVFNVVAYIFKLISPLFGKNK